MHKDNAALKGVYTFTLAEMVERQAKKIEEIIQEARLGSDPEKVKFYIDLLNKKFGHRPLVVDNIIPTVGRSVLAQRLANTTTYTGVVNKVALGSSSTAVANTDTILGAETYRNTAASLTYSNNIAYITGFFSAAECSGTYAEAGLFIDGTGSANTGQLFSHVLASITKTSAQTLTIDWTLTIS